MDTAPILTKIWNTRHTQLSETENMMKEFFKVKTIDQALEYTVQFPRMAPEKVSLTDSVGRILAEDIQSDIDLPDF